MSSKYYCQNCSSEVKPEDTICPKCGVNLSTVGRRIELTITESIAMSDLAKIQPKTAKRLIRMRKEALENTDTNRSQEKNKTEDDYACQKTDTDE